MRLRLFAIGALAAVGAGVVSSQVVPATSRSTEERVLLDWPNLAAYRSQNAQLGPPAAGESRVVFLGDSITYAWARQGRKFFPGKPYVNRGIKGQTTPQMLIRFRPDVVALRPKVVVILAGTNDIAGNTGPATLGMIEDNLMSMADIACANGIRVVLASVLPTLDYPWRRGLKPAGKIAELNAWIRQYTANNGMTYLDYYSAMVDRDGGLAGELTTDGVHPNDNGYEVMSPLAETAIADALANITHRHRRRSASDHKSMKAVDGPECCRIGGHG